MGRRGRGGLALHRSTVGALSWLAACTPVDADGDGVLSGEDCDDADADVAPGRLDRCSDPRDEDCSGLAWPCRRLGTEEAAEGWTLELGPNAALGAALACAGADCVVGAPVAEGGGVVAMLRGGSQAGPSWDGLFEALGAADRLGASLAWLPDGRLLAGAPGAGASAADPPIAAGRVHLLPSPPWATRAPVPLAVAEGVPGDCFGASVAGTADRLWIGAPCRGSSWREHPSLPAPMLVDGPGAAMLLQAPDGEGPAGEPLLTIEGDESWDALGSAVLPRVDLEGDGQGEWLVAAPDHHGFDWLNLPARGRVLAVSESGEAPFVLEGDCCGYGRFDALGTAMAVDDLDADGAWDLLLSVPEIEAVDQQGGAWLDRGPIHGGPAHDAEATLAGPDVGSLPAGTGASIAVLDFDCDGVLDVAMGAPRFGSADRPDQGALYLSYGPFDGWRQAGDEGLVVTGGQARRSFGAALATADLDADGCHDLIVGAPGAGGAESGSVVVIPGGR